MAPTSKTDLKHQAQDRLLQGMANAILLEEEAHKDWIDDERIKEMREQARRVMKFFKVESFPGLGDA